MLRWLIWISLLVALSAVAGTVYVDYRINHREPVYVIGVPAEALEKPVIASYGGPHPSQWQRPKESFPFPIRLGQVGPVQPLFAGPLQYPFLCGVSQSGWGQPLVDNQHSYGIPIYGENTDGSLTEEVVGYSKDCLLPTTAGYYYNRVGTRRFFPLAEADNDIAKVTVGGEEVDFVVRLEVGTINRFMYGIAVLRGHQESLHQPNGALWNGRLIYQFRGGVGIGHKQGKLRPSHLLHRRFDELAQGYAVAYSTANQTSNHYNIWLSEDTALRVKRQFTALYGEPLYTVGIGGSGGAIQQYLIGQNNPELLDGAIALYSYPDMASQIISVFDCELLEHFFDVTDGDNPRWRDWKNRSLVEGFNAVSEQYNKFAMLQTVADVLSGQWRSLSMGLSECVNSWRALTPLVHNPRFFHKQRYFAPAVYDQVDWTYWDDLKQFYGTDLEGNPLTLWDNVGVQYGLQALVNRDITVEEFLKLNRAVGSWYRPQQMQAEHYWLLNDGDYLPMELSVWSEHNMRLEPGERVAPRYRGDLAAIEAAYRSGQVFVGRFDLPVIDLRHYLEPELDMHHSMASFSTRQRIIDAMGHAEHQVIWMTRPPHNPIPLALEVMDEWLVQQKMFPQRGLLANRPVQAVDACFTKRGELIAAGSRVWDGKWNNKPQGVCAKRYPIYSSSRQVAGGSIRDDVFKCALQSVEQAIAQGLYGEQDMRPYLRELKRVFPQGVCDYRLGDAGRPDDLFSPLWLVQQQAAPEAEEGKVSDRAAPAVTDPEVDDGAVITADISGLQGRVSGKAQR